MFLEYRSEHYKDWVAKKEREMRERKKQMELEAKKLGSSKKGRKQQSEEAEQASSKSSKQLSSDDTEVFKVWKRKKEREAKRKKDSELKSREALLQQVADLERAKRKNLTIRKSNKPLPTLKDGEQRKVPVSSLVRCLSSSLSNPSFYPTLPL